MKKILAIFSIFILLFAPVIPVEASIDNEKTSQRKVIDKGYDSTSDSYIFEYQVYTKKGLYEGTINIPSSIYNLEHWFLQLIPGNRIGYYIYTCNIDNLYFSVSPLTSSNPTFFCSSSSYKSGIDLDYYSFVPDYGSEWTKGSSKISYMFDSVRSELDFNCILYSKNLDIDIVNRLESSECHSLSYYIFDIKFENPTIGYMPEEGFRIFLNDYHGATTSTTIYEAISGLMKVSINIYDLDNNKNSVFKDDKVLAYSDVQSNSEGKYYIDLLFSDYLTFLNSSSCNYLINIKCDLKVDVHILSDTSDVLDNTTLYQSSLYTNYRYNANNKTGLLILVDKDGNEIDVGGGGGGENPPEEKDPNQSVVDAVGRT